VPPYLRLVVAFACLKRLERCLVLVRRYADAGVGYRKARPLPATAEHGAGPKYRRSRPTAQLDRPVSSP